MKRAVAAVVALVAGEMVALATITDSIHVYRSPLNGGIAVGDCYHFDAGFEVYGPEGPGFYINEC